MNRLIEEVSEYVQKLFETFPSLFLYHNLEHTREVVEIVEDLAENSGVKSEDSEILLIAAWFHDVGYIESIPLHEEKSAEIAEGFLKSKNYAPVDVEKVKNLILSTKVPQNPQDKLQEIMCDADIAYIGKTDFLSRIDKLREEWDLTIQKKYSNVEWFKSNINFLKSHSFYTEYAKANFGETREKNLAVLKQKLTAEEEKS